MTKPTIYFADINDPDETGTEQPNFCDVVLAEDFAQERADHNRLKEGTWALERQLRARIEHLEVDNGRLAGLAYFGEHEFEDCTYKARVDELRAELARSKATIDGMHAEHWRVINRVAELEALINHPHTDDWFEGVRLEAAHQVNRWGAPHDQGKTAVDWVFLIGHLATKACLAFLAGDETKAKHHTISTAAVCLNWFRAITGTSTAMRPGIEETK